MVVQNTAPANAPVFAHQSAGWQLHGVVTSRPRQHYVEKRLPSAFVGTDLGSWVTANEIDTLVVAGYMTHHCDDSTIRQAMHEGLSVEFLDDAAGSLPYANRAGSASAEELHRSFKVALQSRLAAVMGTDEWIGVLETKGTPVRDNLFASNQRGRGLA